jgi:hypothetical protein
MVCVYFLICWKLIWKLQSKLLQSFKSLAMMSLAVSITVTCSNSTQALMMEPDTKVIYFYTFISISVIHFCRFGTVKFSLCMPLRHNGVGGGGGVTAPLILNPDTRLRVRYQLHVLATLPPGKQPQYPMNRRLGGPRASANILENRPISGHHKLN